jgi:hypothetical protein
MKYKGVEYVIAASATPGTWKWQFRIGDQTKTGKTETRISLLAVRRVQLRIDRELKKLKGALSPWSQPGTLFAIAGPIVASPHPHDIRHRQALQKPISAIHTCESIERLSAGRGVPDLMP